MSNIDIGLRDIVATNTSVCSIIDGKLAYRGHGIDELVSKASFGEVAHLLLFG